MLRNPQILGGIAQQPGTRTVMREEILVSYPRQPAVTCRSRDNVSSFDSKGATGSPLFSHDSGGSGDDVATKDSGGS